jgi:hypothetical protein
VKRLGSRGSLTVEAAVALPFFLFGFILYLFVVKAACIQMALDCAVRETAREIASSAYPLSFYNEWEDEREEKPKAQEENGPPDLTGQIIRKLLSGELNENDLEGFIGEAAKGAGSDLLRVFPPGIDSAGQYAAEKIMQKNMDLRYLEPGKLTLRLVELPKSEYAFKEKTGNPLYLEYGLVPGKDFGPDDVVVLADYLLEIPLPFLKEAVFTIRHAAIERAWLSGSNGVVTEHKEKGLFEQDADEEAVTVYVTRTGKKYHSSGCRYLRKSKIPVTLKEAKRQYEPCKVCRPPR